MKSVYILDGIGDVLMVAQVKEDHFVLMCARQWIRSNNWIKADAEVLTMSHTHLIEFVNESAL